MKFDFALVVLYAFFALTNTFGNAEGSESDEITGVLKNMIRQELYKQANDLYETHVKEIVDVFDYTTDRENGEHKQNDKTMEGIEEETEGTPTGTKHMKPKHFVTLIVLFVFLTMLLILLWCLCSVIQRTAIWVIKGLIVLSFLFLILLCAGYISAYYGWFDGTVFAEQQTFNEA